MLSVFCFTVNHFEENTYLLACQKTKEAIVIDPGFIFPEEFNTFYSTLEDNSLTLKGVYNTHCHIDHILGLSRVVDKYKLPFYAHNLEMANISSAPIQAMMYSLPSTICPTPTGYISEQDLIHFGEIELQILFVPGHSPGHLAFYHKQSHQLFSGDVLFQRSIGRTDLPGGDFNTLINSIKLKLFTLPDETIVYSGHGGSTTILEEKQFNPYLKN